MPNDQWEQTSVFGRRWGKTTEAIAWLREDPADHYMFAGDNKATRAMASRHNLIVEEVTANGRKVSSVLLRARPS